MGAPAISTRPRTKPAPQRRPARPAGKAAAPKKVSRAAAAAPARRPAPRKRAPASATAQRKSASAAPARRPARTRSRPAPSGSIAMAPLTAVGRTATAVGGIADSSFVVSLTRGRAWIALLGVLLGGIVAINVWGLGLSADGSATALKVDALERDNSMLRGRVVRRTSNDQIQAEALKLGLAIPPADTFGYLRAGEGDATEAAKRLSSGEITAAATSADADAAAATAEAATDPATGFPIDPASGLAVDPATGLATDPGTGAAIDPATGLPAVAEEAATTATATTP